MIKVKFEDMERISNDLEHTINETFCGYLKQLMKAKLLKEGQYLISGKCSLTHHHCERLIVKYEPVPLCEHYPSPIIGVYLSSSKTITEAAI